MAQAYDEPIMKIMYKVYYQYYSSIKKKIKL